MLVNDRLKKEKVKTDEFCIKLWYSSKTESFHVALEWGEWKVTDDFGFGLLMGKIALGQDDGYYIDYLHEHGEILT